MLANTSSVFSTLFTFHNVSINTEFGHFFAGSDFHLHSTMFLLIPVARPGILDTIFHLHSTMFLLILKPFYGLEVSCLYLHSTMFLLILCFIPVWCIMRIYLHSTMFLLIPIPYNRSFYKPNLTTFCQPCHFIII